MHQRQAGGVFAEAQRTSADPHLRVWPQPRRRQPQAQRSMITTKTRVSEVFAVLCL